MTERIEKTVFISYRRTNFYTALAVYQDLTQHGYDVFFDFQSIDSGDFEKIITENIKAKAHFLIIFSPSALERCNEPGDWLRREIEMAMDEKRNIVPLMMEGFDFGSPSVKEALSGKLSTLNRYNGLRLVADYFFEAMEKLRGRFLNVALEDIRLHPLNPEAKEITEANKVFTNEAAPVQLVQLTAEEWFERGYVFVDDNNFEEAIRCYTEAIHLQPDFAKAYYNRGTVHGRYKSDMDAAIDDLTKAITLQPDFAEALDNRGNALSEKGELDDAIKDYTESIRLKPDSPTAYNNRGLAHKNKGDLEDAVKDYTEAIRLKPDYVNAYHNRGLAHKNKGDLEDAVKDYTEAISLQPNGANAYYNRALIWEKKGKYPSAITDYQKYLDLGGGERDGNQEEVEEKIKKLKSKLTKKKSLKKKAK